MLYNKAEEKGRGWQNKIEKGRERQRKRERKKEDSERQNGILANPGLTQPLGGFLGV